MVAASEICKNMDKIQRIMPTEDQIKKNECLCKYWTAEMNDDMKIKTATIRTYVCPLHP